MPYLFDLSFSKSQRFLAFNILQLFIQKLSYLFPLHRIIFNSGFLMDDLISLQFQSHPGRVQHFSFMGVHVTKTWFEVNNLVSKSPARFTGPPRQLHKSGSTLTKCLKECLIFWSVGKFYKKIKLIQQRYQIHPFVLAW